MACSINNYFSFKAVNLPILGWFALIGKNRLPMYLHSYVVMPTQNRLMLAHTR
jgi:hypothetical protein